LSVEPSNSRLSADPGASGYIDLIGRAFPEDGRGTINSSASVPFRDLRCLFSVGHYVIIRHSNTQLCDDTGMYRHPLWIGEVDLVRAIFGHAANADPDRLLSIAPVELAGQVTQAVLEQRLGNRRLDVLVSVRDENNGDSPGRWLVVEAKVGAVVEASTLVEYLSSVRERYGPATGLLVAPYQPVGDLPVDWDYRNLEDVADQLSCLPRDGVPPCTVCEEISHAVSESVSSARVTEWRELTEATRSSAIPDDWVTAGSGSSVGRPLVWFQSPWLDENRDSYVQVEVGNRFGLPAASVMLVKLAGNPRNKAVIPDKLWKALAIGSATAPVLAEGVADGSSRGRGAKDRQVADGARRNGVPPTWSLGYNMKGWHGRGRVLHHANGDYKVLLPAAIEQGAALYETAKRALQG
jgi:hypothetical protein